MADLDLIVIGSGAGAAPVALTCANAGLRTLVLEKGPELRDEDYRSSEHSLLHNYLLPDVSEARVVCTRKNPQGVRHMLGWSANCVGGGTVHMGGFLYRFAPEDFRVASAFGGDHSVCDWPLDYDEFAPWYALAEQALGVAGNSAVLHSANSHERLPMPPLPAHPAEAIVRRALDTLRWSHIVTPRAINSLAYQGRRACAQCDACAGYGCRFGAKNSVQRSILASAATTGKLTIRADSRVTRLLCDGNRIVGCEYLDAAGEQHVVRARHVVLSAGAIESARLLLMSGCSAHPNGIGNWHGQVGRHLQFHGTTMGTARFHKRLFGRHLSTEQIDSRLPFLGLTCTQHQSYGHPARKGGLIRFDRGSNKPYQNIRIIQALRPQHAFYGAGLRAALHAHYREYFCVSYEAFHEFPPNQGTFMDLDPEICDPAGVPVARLQFSPPPSIAETGRYLAMQADLVFDEIGHHDRVHEIVGGTTSYLNQGTCRFGDDPRRSVLDRNCKVHGIENLHVVDASFMPTSGSAPPTLTIIANAFRVGTKLAQTIGKGKP